jgi:hypothetical protein
MLLKLRSTSYKSLSNRSTYLNIDTATNSKDNRNSLNNSPNKQEIQKPTESYNMLSSTISPSTKSYDLWLDSYNAQNTKIFNDECILKSVKKNDQMNSNESKTGIFNILSN